MSLILNIDTATENASVSLSKNGTIIIEQLNNTQKDHGAFLQPAIKAMLVTSGIKMQDIDGVAISAGPGSYTGLRVGMSSAKGLCYALNKPLITIDSLQVLTYAAITASAINVPETGNLYCPMIDARRMEVFTALYNQSLETVLNPCALVLNEKSFANSLLKNTILFFGNGADKWKNICRHPNAFFVPMLNNTLAMSKLAYKKFSEKDFANMAYCEPSYLKEFFQTSSTS